MSTLKTLPEPLNVMRFGCRTCGRHHDVEIPCLDSTRLLHEFESWQYKHAGHDMPMPVSLRREIPRDFDDSQFEASGHEPWWLGMRENTNFQAAFTASASLTITSFNSLASDSNLLAGASSAVVDNGATAAPLEQWVSAQIKNGTTPTASKQVNLYLWSKLNDSTYPDAISGSDATISISSTEAVQFALKLAAAWPSSTTTGGTYPAGWHTLGSMAFSQIFGFIPRYWGAWIVHDSVAAFASSGHVVSYKSSYVAG